MAAKYLLLAAQLRQRRISLLRKGEHRFPSETELCAETGYSRETVRHAILLLEEEGLLMRVRGSGTYLTESGQNSAGRIAVLTCCRDEYLYPQLLRDIEAVFRQRNYRTEQYSTDNSVETEREILQQLLADQPAGILIEGAKSAMPDPNQDLLSALEKQKVPTVWLHASPSGASLAGAAEQTCVQDDNIGGARLLAKYLLDKGHRQIAGIFKYDDGQGLERYRGFMDELLQAGCMPPDETLCWYGTKERETLLGGRLDWLHRFVASELRNCSAVVCYNDEIAYPLIQCLLTAGKRVPEDVAVVSFDNSHYCRLSPVPITSLGHEKHQMGSSAALTLLAKIRGKQVRSVLLPWTLYERESG